MKNLFVSVFCVVVLHCITVTVATPADAGVTVVVMSAEEQKRTWDGCSQPDAKVVTNNLDMVEDLSCARWSNSSCARASWTERCEEAVADGTTELTKEQCFQSVSDVAVCAREEMCAKQEAGVDQENNACRTNGQFDREACHRLVVKPSHYLSLCKYVCLSTCNQSLYLSIHPS